MRSLSDLLNCLARRAVLAVLVSILAACTAMAPVNVPIDHDDLKSGYRLSNMLKREDASGGELPFTFINPTIALQDALQTNQLFLVVVNPTNLVDVPADFENVVEIAGWSMAAKVGIGVSATALSIP